MWNFSRTAVPPDVSSMSSEALFMLVLSVSQWPTRDFSFSNASAPPGAAAVFTVVTEILRINRPTAFIIVLILFLLPDIFPTDLSRRGIFHSRSKLLRRESHNQSHEHARQHDVPEKTHARF